MRLVSRWDDSTTESPRATGCAPFVAHSRHSRSSPSFAQQPTLTPSPPVIPPRRSSLADAPLLAPPRVESHERAKVVVVPDGPFLDRLPYQHAQREPQGVLPPAVRVLVSQSHCLLEVLGGRLNAVFGVRTRLQETFVILARLEKPRADNTQM